MGEISQGEKRSEDQWLHHKIVTEASQQNQGIYKSEKLDTATEAASHRWVLSINIKPLS